MKKLMLFFIGAGMTLVSCKSHLDGLASNRADDVYYNPAKERKANVPPPVQQYDSRTAYNPNAGKIGATEADKNNPYYQDPKFNYDDYYDNAYASRVKRFQNPIYGTSYYDSYYTNSYFYNGNPNMYGNSIYNSYNMGPSYGSYYSPYSSYGYSPYSSYYNPYYSNPYYNSGYGYGNSMSIGFGYGYGSGMYGYNPYGYSYNPYGMCGYSPYGYGYNPYGMGYNPYGMGYGYSPYGYGMGGGYGYSPYGYGMGYGGYPMYSSGYYNSYDYNSNTYHYGPRGTHSGGNSTTTSSPHSHREMNPNPVVTTVSEPNSAPFATGRFNQVEIPKETYHKIVEARNPVRENLNYGGGGYGYENTGKPNYSGSGMSNSGYENTGRPNGNHFGGYTNTPTYSNGNGMNEGSGNGGNYSAPRYIPNNSTPGTTTEPQAQPHKWYNGVSWGGGATDNGNSSPSYSTPSSGRWGGNSGGSWGGSSGGGGSWGGGGSSGGGGGGSHPRR